MFYDPETQTIAGAHAGWRGTYSGITGIVIDELVQNYGVKTHNLIIGIGPSISVNHYEVDKNLAQQFVEKFDDSHIQIRNGKYYLDLWKCNREQIIAKGVPEKNIEISGLCSFERKDEFYSYRRDNSEKGRFANGICLK